MADEDHQSVIEKDQKNYPDCSYGTEKRTTTTSDDAQGMKCETIMKIYRYCPGKPKTEIYNKKEFTSDNHTGNTDLEESFSDLQDAATRIFSSSVVQPLSSSLLSIFDELSSSNSSSTYGRSKRCKDDKEFKGPVDEV